MSYADLIGSYGETVVAVWPGRRYAVRRIALERAGGELLLLADDHVLERFPLLSVGRAFSAFAELNPLPLATLEDALAGTEVVT